MPIPRSFECCECGFQFGEEDNLALDEVAEELPDGGFIFVEAFCPKCGSDDVEDLDNLEAVRDMTHQPP